MSFRDLELKPEYRSKLSNVVKDFYNPVLRQAVQYKRAVGFFSSSALVSMTAGICGLVENGGTIQLIASPRLLPEDIDAINDGLKRRDDVIKEALLRELREPKGRFEEVRLNLLSNLIAAGRMEIKIAFMEDDNTIGMFHEKLGLMYDVEGNIIAFSGSMNETANAFSNNYEAIDVYASWLQDSDRVLMKQSAFNAMWEDYEPSIRVLNFPDVREELLQRYRVTNTIDTSFDDEEPRLEPISIDIPPSPIGPSVPEYVHIRPYQNDAIDAWAKQGYCGIFDMATGTGKTYTALAAIARLFSDLNNNLAVIIICPYQHLVEQWREDIVAFGMKPIVCYSASSQRNWRERLKNAVTSFTLGVQDHFCMVSTNATFSLNYVQDIITKLSGNVVLVVDEAHNFGAEKLSQTLLPHIPYRLALSATIDRHGDPEGTQKLYDYFGNKCIEYTLKDAIDNDMLTPYYYYPVTVSLNEEELSQYIDLTGKIRRNIHQDKAGKIILSEYAKMLLIKRARIVAGAVEKINTLKSLLEKHKEDNQILIYCGATTLHDVDYQEGKPAIEEARQIDIVANMLGNDLGMRVSKFTSEENAEERELLKADFAEGKHLQALVAIRCLDEGVNIPSIHTAFILASSTNPKEYVQRRGRVLRKFAGKRHAIIYDFITLPIPLKEVGKYSPEVLEGVKSLAMREIIRMKDFAAIAENPFDSDSLIAEIQRTYDIELESVSEEDEYV
jgi:superfamily II DNA or RNA helicase